MQDSNTPPAGLRISFEFVLGLVVLFLVIGAIKQGSLKISYSPYMTATPASTATATPVELLNLVGNNVVATIPPVAPLALPAMSDAVWSPDRPTPINNSGWETISDAASMEPGCIAKYIYATWLTESGELDCTEALTRSGQNECRSSAGAEGPLQFMGAFNEAGISEPGWSKANLHDSTRAACRMWTKMDLWSHVGDRTSFALRFSSLDVYNAGRIPQFWTDRAWNVGQDGYNQALRIWDNVNQIEVQ